jgi:predicted hydrolase (HD superfamily)
MDYERFPDMSDTEKGHPRTALRLFREEGYPADLIHAVEVHATFLGVSPENRLDRALLACDEITGLILACAYVRPSKDIRDVKLSSIKKKWKDKSFTAAIDRDETRHYIEAFGVPFDDHLTRILEAMQSIAPQLGMDGQ